MASIADFFSEVDEIFGFYFDVGLACQREKLRVEEMQRKRGMSDDCLMIYGHGKPQHPPEQEKLRAAHTTTISELRGRLDRNGFDIRKAAEATLVFVYQLWEDKYRRSVVGRDGQPLGEISSDTMGDLRLLRHCILHTRAVADSSVEKCKVITKFKPGEKIVLDGRDMEMILKTIKSELQKYAA